MRWIQAREIDCFFGETVPGDRSDEGTQVTNFKFLRMELDRTEHDNSAETRLTVDQRVHGSRFACKIAAEGQRTSVTDILLT